jgi:predicted dehydrogenase
MRRVLIVGSGSAGIRHLETARRLLPLADIRVLRHRESSEVLANADGCFSRLEEALNFKPEAVVIANPAPFHVQIAREFVRARCHTLIEKPLAHASQGVKELLDEARGKQLILQVGYNLRFLSCLKEFRRLIQAGELGEVLSVHAEVGQHLSLWRPGKDYRQGVSAQAALGGGVLLELSHEIDYLRWIFGEVSWVSAWIGQLGDLEIDVEDSAYLVLGFHGEFTSHKVVASLKMDFVRQDSTRFCVARGTRASLRWDGIGGKVESYRSGDTAWSTVFEKGISRHASYVEEWKSFLSSIKTNSRPEVVGEDGLAVLRVIEASRQSNEQGGLRISLKKMNF